MTTSTPPGPAHRRRAFPPFRTPVRGHAFAARPPDVVPPAPGQRVRLAREPDNPRDHLAVAVWVGTGTSAWRIGYLDGAVAARLAPRLDRGELVLDARVDGWQPEPEGRWHRPVVRLAGVTGPAGTGGAAGADRWGEPPRSVVRTVGRGVSGGGRPGR